jgi:hypothetical protein
MNEKYQLYSLNAVLTLYPVKCIYSVLSLLQWDIKIPRIFKFVTASKTEVQHQMEHFKPSATKLQSFYGLKIEEACSTAEPIFLILAMR